MIKPLTSLRFFAAAAVVIYHIGFSSVLGELGINFFFVLSGFIISSQYVDRLGTASGVGAFYVSRAARIFPLHLVCMLVAVPISAYESLSVSAGRTALTALLLNSWIPGDSFTYNFVAWTLSVELFFYLLTPLIVRLLAGRSGYFYLGLSIACGLLMWTAKSKLYPLMNNDVHSPWWWFIFVSPYFYILAYLTGVGAGLGWLKVRDTVACSVRTWTLWEAASLIVGAAALYGILALGFKREPMVLAFALAIFVFAFAGGWISRVLSWRPLVFLGEISFSLYMVHQLMMRAVDNHIVWITYPAAEWWQQAIFTVALLFVSWVGFRFIEEPCRMAVKGWMRRGSSVNLPALQKSAAP